MNIEVTTDNCDKENYYLVECAADGELNIKISFKKIISIQSKKERQRDICAIIQSELSKFKWIITGRVNIEFTWFLNSVERQETDKVGDIDNITKPILDSLTGTNGIILDDYQISSIYTFWQSRNDLIADNIVYIKISFNNDEIFEKENLIFIQYSGAVCRAMNVDFTDFRSIFGAFITIWMRKNDRNTAKAIKRFGGNVDRLLIPSPFEVHRTRLNGFDSNIIYKLSDFKIKCKESGFTYLSLINQFRKLKQKQSE